MCLFWQYTKIVLDISIPIFNLSILRMFEFLSIIIDQLELNFQVNKYFYLDFNFRLSYCLLFFPFKYNNKLIIRKNG